MRRIFLGLAAALSGMMIAGQTARAEPSHALAMHGEPALEAGFKHFPYVNPDAPKGGRIDYAVQGTFNSLNPFIVQGDGARGLFDAAFGITTFDTLMMRSRDEPFTLYPLLAETVETDEERSFVEFTLDARARFSDGTPVTAGRRHLHDGAFSRQGAAALPELDQDRRPHGEGRRAWRAVHLQRQGRPRVAAAAGAAADPAQGTRPMQRTSTSRRLRPCPARVPMRSSDVKTGRICPLEAAARLLGQGHSLEGRLRQLRRDPHQLHP